MKITLALLLLLSRDIDRSNTMLERPNQPQLVDDTHESWCPQWSPPSYEHIESLRRAIKADPEKWAPYLRNL